MPRARFPRIRAPPHSRGFLAADVAESRRAGFGCRWALPQGSPCRFKSDRPHHDKDRELPRTFWEVRVRP